ncbi:hypothetical protein ACS0TY_029436 [Phlomoides rotata]
MQNIIPYGSPGIVGTSSGDDLEQDYGRIKQHIQDDCKFLLDISSTENLGHHVFSFLANSILKEVLSAMQKGKPGAFSPGRPTEFLKNYKLSLALLEYLEDGYCPSRAIVAKQREEAVCIKFLKQWNTGVYFSLRYSNWLSVGLRVRKTGNVSANSGFEWAVSASPDDFLYESAYWSMHLNSYRYGLSGRESTYHGVYEDNGPVPGLDFNKRAWEYPSMTTTEDPITVDIP